MLKPNPFTPKSGSEPKIFFNREEEIEFFLKRVEEAKDGLIKHYIVNGEWGSGKTSLLRYFKVLAQNKNSVGCYFLAKPLTESMSDVEMVSHLLQSIVRGLPYKISAKGTNFFKSMNGFGINILGTGFNISFDISDRLKVDSQILLTDGLLNIWRDIKRKTELLTILIDDVQNYTSAKSFFIILKNVLSDAEIINKTQILFVLSSTIEEWKPFMKENHPIGRFFIPRRELKNFDKQNTIEFLDAVLEDTGVKFSKIIKEKIFKYTNGHLFQIHSLGGALYDNQKEGLVTKNQWDKGFEEGLFYLGNAVYDGISQNLSSNEIKILQKFDIFNTNKIVDIMDKTNIKSLNVYLRRLVEKEILIGVKRGEYKLKDILLCEYLRRK